MKAKGGYMPAIGDIVQVKDSKNVRQYDEHGKGVGYQFQITKNEIYSKNSGRTTIEKAYYYLPVGNKFGTNYLATDLKLIKKSTMAKKKAGLQLEDGMYFTANYKRSKFRGKVLDVNSSYDEDVYQLINKGFGEEEDNADNNGGWSHFIEVTRRTDNHDDGEQTWEDALKAVGVTSFEECKDKRQIKIIDADQNPKIGEYIVTKTDDGYKFGCGAVEVTDEELESIVNVKNILGKREDELNIHDSEIVINLQDEDKQGLKDTAKWLLLLADCIDDLDIYFEKAKEIRSESSGISIDEITVAQIAAMVKFFG